MRADLDSVLCTLTEVPTSAPLPTEFRIFKAGINATTKGEALFDDVAAKAVMAAYATHGVDLMIDVNHDSLTELPLAMRADASDARGWFRLELRGGELWATDVRWTPDGEERLRSKKQRYISPAFKDAAVPGSKAVRPTKIVNAALCARPATHGAPPLVATLTPEDRLRGQEWVRKIKMRAITIASAKR